MLQPPTDDVLHRVADLVPGSAEGLRGFLPGKLSGPVGQELHVDLGELVLAVGPRHLFDDDATAGTFHPPHGVQQEDQESPDRDELESALGQMIVATSGLQAARANSGGTRPRPNAHFDGGSVGAEPRVFINESWRTMALV